MIVGNIKPNKDDDYDLITSEVILKCRTRKDAITARKNWYGDVRLWP